MDIRVNKTVAVYKTDCMAYPNEKPYHPSLSYPEISYNNLSEENNSVFDAVRNSLFLLGFDNDNYGSSTWNPLRSLVKPRDLVVIKPNLVSHFNWGYKQGLTDTSSLITHGSVIRVVVDYVALAMEGSGTIIIGDSPVQLSAWDDLMRMIGFKEMQIFFETIYPSIALESSDFRLGFAKRNKFGVMERFENKIDFQKFVEVDLSKRSLLSPITNHKTLFGVVDYSRYRLMNTHNTTTHKYLIPRVILDADVVINLPKLKTHSKAGITGSLKNFVGINSHKDYLPHFRFGSPKSGGDEYPDKGFLFAMINTFTHKEWEYSSGKSKFFYASLAKGFKLLYLILYRKNRSIFNLNGGGWFGNDTLWRTILDINRTFFYAGKDYEIKAGNIQAKKYFTLIDGIVGGEKMSPLLPSPKPAGFIVAGINPVAVDTVAATLIGIDYKKIPQIDNAYKIIELPLISYKADEIEINSNIDSNCIDEIINKRKYISFEPSIGYKNHIELTTTTLYSNEENFAFN